MEFGVNVDPLNWPDNPYKPAELLAATGATWTRTVLRANDNVGLVQSYFEGCVAHSIHELGVVARESCNFSEHPNVQELEDGINKLLDLYKNQVDIWQIGNQPDNPAPDSWTQDEDTTNIMLRLAAYLIPNTQGLIAAPALVTGKNYNIDLDLKYIDYRAINLYTLASQYKGSIPGNEFNTNSVLLVTEYPSNIPSLGAKIVSIDQAIISFVFCLSDKMYPGLGLYDVNDKPTRRFYAFKKLVEANS